MSSPAESGHSPQGQPGPLASTQTNTDDGQEHQHMPAEETESASNAARTTATPQHAYRETTDGRYECTFRRHNDPNRCGRTYRELSMLQAHYRHTHDKFVDSSRCTICGALYPSVRDMRWHQNASCAVDLTRTVVAKAPPLRLRPCPVCRVNRMAGLTWVSHMNEQHAMGRKGAVCPFQECGPRVETWEDMEMHLEEVHETGAVSLSPSVQTYIERQGRREVEILSVDGNEQLDEKQKRKKRKLA
ncbi:hypothetical protein ASPACDRAFT_48363 [Aspergillus aculeatus ATCC 16872]|uniref:C2H2-type domain-containing protein n=1 Tax=Aspergillus aculeatus (strain ATCC 16872 / CBS 172.66 / WB 5094) TaxID=690307 RepID=A0A1L9WFH5_ASPA1|nr:uncharacterized protein ASPACDRAFT_48363 [Aspergillus aculeatus ATCC 16872]OJJ94914.1 hypothetical protein ASPACDRAFT_48363 [Aspergillus aculeatus ATCC 16872]